MKTILRNLLSILRRFKMAALLNVFGLSVAFCAFMLIMMQLNYDREYDRCYPNAGSVFRVDLVDDGYIQAVVSRPFGQSFISSSPHIESGAIVNIGQLSNEFFFSIDKAGTKVMFQEQMLTVTPDFTRLFSFDMQEGNAAIPEGSNKVVLPASMASRLFDSEPAVGKQLTAGVGDGFYTVGGVYRDFPGNASVNNVIYTCMDPKKNADQWFNRSYSLYVRLDSPENAEAVIANYKKHFDAAQIFGKQITWEDDKVSLRLTALGDLHFVTNALYDQQPKASRQTMWVLFAIAFVILIIAGINFTNFSTALTPMRIKSINTQKVLGSTDRVLRGSLIAEAVIISVFSFLLSVGILYVLNDTPVAGLVDADISFMLHPVIVGVTGLLSVLVGLFAGLYPSYYVTSFPPALALKGNFGLSPKGRQFRNVLIGVQFVASFVLIIASLFMYLQNYYMQHSPLGYDKDEVIITNINRTMNKSREAFTNQLKSFSGIDNITYSEVLLSSGDAFMGWGRSYNGKGINFQCVPVDPSFLKVMGIELLEGRDFRSEDELTEHGAIIFNERARSDYEMKLNEKVDGSEIIGFIPDVKFASFRAEVEPMAFYVWGKERWGSPDRSYAYAYIKVKAGSDLHAAMNHVRSSLKQFDPEYSFDIRFYDVVLNQTYEKEQRTTALITLFSLIAVFISIVGVFGLVVFDSEYRRKEIGVRKVLGSTTTEILILFNKTYVRLLILCFILSTPVAYYVVNKWLENFAYRTPVYWWVFAVAFLLVMCITTLTVTFQNWRASNENPVKSLKSE